jgi:uncharacterized protein (DUF1684 family)
MRHLAFAFSLLAALTLSACGDNASSNDESTAAADTATETASDPMDVTMPELPADEMAGDEMAADEAADEDPEAAWQRDMVDYGNEAYAGRPRAILKIDDAVYLDEGQTAWLVRHEDSRVHFLFTLEEPEDFVLSISYTGATAPMTVRGQTEADELIRGAMADMDVELDGLGLEYDMLRYHEDHESYVIEEGVQLTAYPAQLEPGKTGLRTTVFNENNPAAAHFEGLRFYDYNPDMIVEASFTPLDEFEPKVFQTSRGWYKQFYHVGDATFSVGGETMVMPMYGFVTDPAEVNVMSAFFTDANAGTETYGVGRYIDVELEEGSFPPETVTLDFNYAYNPNCARSSYYNCPVAEFDIPVAIRAGEMLPEGH